MAASERSADLDAASRTGARARTARLRTAMAVVALVCLLCGPLFVETVDRDAPRPVAGRLDLTGYHPLSAPIALAGQWRFVWRTGPPGPPAGSQRFMQMPGSWSDKGSSLPEQGAASYHLLFTGLRPGRYMLYVPTVYAASRVSVNGRVLSEQGVAGPTDATTDPTVRSHDVLIDADGLPMDLQVDVSSFRQRENGLEVAPMFGLAKPMNQWTTLHWLRSMLLLTCLMVLACYGMIIFVFRRRELGWFWFAFSALGVMPVMAVFSHDNLILVAAPGLSLLGMRVIEYTSVVVALGAILAYTEELFPRESPKTPLRLFQGVVAIDLIAYAVAAAANGTMGLSEVAYWSLWVRIGVLAFVLWIVTVAAIRRRRGAAVYLLGMVMFFSAMIYTDLMANGFLPAKGAGLDVLPLGMLVMLLSQIVIMAERWGGAIDAAESTSGELRQLLDVNVAIASEIELAALLRRIVQVTSQILQADRSSLFLYDDRTDELWSMVAEGVDSREIRFPARQGLAGDCFYWGEAVNVTDAYADSRFNQAVDKATGYRTRTVLSAPVVTRDGRKLGVMQAFNRLDGDVFDDSDVERMNAFAAQAAVAIENATLFGEVASERNYNDSILRSMSSGVVTLDREARVVKLNAAACAILGVAPEAAGDPETQAALVANNPWLVDEIRAVAASGQPKTLLDADLVTVPGETISANASIVPLMADEGQAGLLIIVEDISEGKRLQGAMRRFMSQNVVDQIMGREDELLFGAACQASILFADIRGFTSLAEHLGPRDTVDMLNEIFTDLFEAVAGSDGMLDKFIGDAIMAVYGAPLSSGRDELNAVDSAVAMAGMMVAINQRRAGRGTPAVRLGVGIASGEVVAGTIGSPKRMDYTVIGDSVNLASRLEGITKIYGVGIVICEDTALAVGTAHPMRELDAIKVRGRQQPERIFQVLTADAPVSAVTLEAYARGREAMAAGRWPEAIAAFESALAATPDDSPSALMLGRARTLAETPPPAGWDGVWDSAKAA
ncbi:adenylate/guanylate cyclase domain-containing protein [Phenylobacterium sp.]|uniref:adenylate/guanylate cyclase domain-containing protein n=1 Tax=Phenylobacterium sp. TaxID=1871053 RepID=UPI0025E03ECE|nr:adenylate/guanylate cyclase domain-containing protein [Phenylobacterium sp.]